MNHIYNPWVVVPASILAIGFYCRHSILDKLKITITNYLLTGIQEKSNSSEPSFKINRGNSSATLTFDYHGTSHQIHVPFDRSKSTKMLGAKVYLSMSDGSRIDVTQKPGVPYILKAEEMGGHCYIVCLAEEDEIYLPSDELPTF